MVSLHGLAGSASDGAESAAPNPTDDGALRDLLFLRERWPPRERLLRHWQETPGAERLLTVARLDQALGDGDAARRCADRLSATARPGRPADSLRLGLAARLSLAVGDAEAARRHLVAAAEAEPDQAGPIEALLRLLLPGPNYLQRLREIVTARGAATYVEIGVARGDSLKAVQPVRRAIAIDPKPRVEGPLPANATLFAESSDDFFAQCDLPGLLDAPAFDVAFVDGLHLHEQVLRDVANLERHSGPGSLLLLHDCLPVAFNVAERQVRPHRFWTGDTWKALACLRRFRPDLAVVTLPTAPSGLTAVAGLDRRADWSDERRREMEDYAASLGRPPSWDALSTLAMLLPNDDASVATIASLS